MRKRVLFSVVILLLVAAAVSVSQKAGQKSNGISPPPSQEGFTMRVENKAPAAIRGFGKIPIYFIPNDGQVDGPAKFYVRGKDKTVYFTPEGVTFALSYGSRTSSDRRPDSEISPAADNSKRWAVKMDFIGARQDVVPEGVEKTGGVVSYFRGRPEDWQAGLPAYSKIIYRDLWPGIDLIYRGDINKLKYEFIVHPGADPSVIRIALRGADDVRIDEVGRLEIETPAGSFEDETPAAYQDIEGTRVDVPMGFRLEEADAPKMYSYSFSFGEYSKTHDLILDPATILYCGFVGGSSDDERATNVAVDGTGNVYLTGITDSDQTSFPVVAGPDLTHNGGNDAFVAKINPAGTGLVYCGYIGGSGGDYGMGIAVDGMGNAYVAGYTTSREQTFPVVVGPHLTYNAGTNAFIAKINPAGTALIYCGYIGGSSPDYGYSLALDSTGNAYITGYTTSNQSTFPVLVGPDLTYNGGTYDAFIAKVNAAGTALVYCGYIGGADVDMGFTIAVDGSGNAYVAGYTLSTDSSFPVFVGPDLTYNGGSDDAFVAKVNATGSALAYCGYIGGSNDDEAYGIAVDTSGNAYVSGFTGSTPSTFPVTVGPDLTYHGGGDDAFVAKVNSAGTGLVYCGYIGGSGGDYGMAIAVDRNGNAYVFGATYSTQATFPVKGGPDLTFNGGGDAFIAEVKTDGSALVYCGYLGGNRYDGGLSISVDGSGNAYVVGQTMSDQGTFPVTIGPDLTYNGGMYDAFVAKISNNCDLAVTKSVDNLNPVLGTEFHFTVTAKNNGPANASGLKVLDALPAGLTFVSSTPTVGAYTYSTGVWDIGALAKDATATLTLKVRGDIAGVFTNTTNVSALNETDPDSSNNAASVTVNTGLLPPLNFTGQKLLNRSLAMISYVNKLTWKANPADSGFDVAKYRIYRMSGGTPTLLAELDTSKTLYYDRNVQKTTEYQYGLSTVTNQGYESDRAYVTVK